MGDAEFDGGGSVKWEVKNSKGLPGRPTLKGAKGKDDDPPKGTGTFIVSLNGVPQFEAPVPNSKVRIEWKSQGVRATAPRAGISASGARKTTKTARTTTARKSTKTAAKRPRR